jgi:broad specificity phosphatase PhoE
MILVRHGNTRLNGDEKLRSWIDVPLDKKGLSQADQVGKQLKDKKFDGIVTSDLVRSMQTAKRISKQTDRPILESTRGLRPWNLGEWSGKPVMESLDKIRTFATMFPNTAVPGGESFNAFKTRFSSTIKQLGESYPGKELVLVTHHRGDRLVEAWIAAGLDNNDIDPEVFCTKGIEPGTFKEIPNEKLKNMR